VQAAHHEDLGFEAIGTSSAVLASALGRLDGRHAVNREEHLAHARLFGEVSGLPVNGDFEDGYGDGSDDVEATVRMAIDAGLGGIGIEDTSGSTTPRCWRPRWTNSMSSGRCPMTSRSTSTPAMTRRRPATSSTPAACWQSSIRNACGT
jgi:hypothetical protein